MLTIHRNEFIVSKCTIVVLTSLSTSNTSPAKRLVISCISQFGILVWSVGLSSLSDDLWAPPWGMVASLRTSQALYTKSIKLIRLCVLGRLCRLPNCMGSKFGKMSFRIQCAANYLHIFESWVVNEFDLSSSMFWGEDLGIETTVASVIV